MRQQGVPRGLDQGLRLAHLGECLTPGTVGARFLALLSGSLQPGWRRPPSWGVVAPSPHSEATATTGKGRIGRSPGATSEPSTYSALDNGISDESAARNGATSTGRAA